MNKTKAELSCDNHKPPFSFVLCPDVKINWFHKENEIKQSEFFRMSQFDDSCQLEISRVYPEDEGEYTCVATNNAGTASCSATLTLDGELLFRNTAAALIPRLDFN